MEYSNVLKKLVLEQRHGFIYGPEQERTKYLMHLANEYKYDKNKEQPIIIYTNHVGLSDYENKSCEEYRIDYFHQRYFELFMTSLFFEKLTKELPVQEQENLEQKLTELFYVQDIKTMEIAQKELQVSLEIYQDAYQFYIETTKWKETLGKDLKISYVMLDSFLPEIKTIIPQMRDLICIIDKTQNFGKKYTQVINAYVDGRSNSYLNIKVGCKNIRDWDTYDTIIGRDIQSPHDYEDIIMDDYQLTRTKKEK